MYVGENESAKFWLSIMNGLKNRGVEDILIACVDGLNGFPQAIEAVYPETEMKFHKICIVQRYQETDGRSEACIRSTDRRNCLKRIGAV